LEPFFRDKVLADHSDQRRELVKDRSLIPNAIEEILHCSGSKPESSYLLISSKQSGAVSPSWGSL